MEESTLTGLVSKRELSSLASESQALIEPGRTSLGSPEKPANTFSS